MPNVATTSSLCDDGSVPEQIAEGDLSPVRGAR